MARSEKLYKDSPSIERDAETGKPGIKKPTKADAIDMGTEGPKDASGEDPAMPVQVHQVGEAHKRHAQEIKDMHKRHLDEIGSMQKRHLKEIGKASESSGEEIINKVEDNKKESE